MTGWGRPGYNKGMSSSLIPEATSELSPEQIRLIGHNHKHAALLGCAEASLGSLLIRARFGKVTVEHIQQEIDRLAATEAAFDALLDEGGKI